jgi:DMSO/TMAO reductase YedYZ molybdopterin-dependent catalytic subunit
MSKLEERAWSKKWCKQLIVIIPFAIACLNGSAYPLDPPPITPIDEFFVLGSPPPVPNDWHLIVDGEVEFPLALSLEDLMLYPSTTEMSTLECYFPVGPTLFIGNANWSGVRLNTVIQQASPLAGAVSVNFHAIDEYSMGPFSLSELMQRDDILLAYGMNGQTLPPEQGYPLKLVLPGIAGYQNARWLEYIEITASPPNLALNHYPIHAKIFEPLAEMGGKIALGTYVIRGIAYAGRASEITQVEISMDDGATWQPAQLLNYFVPNVWKLWEFTWHIPQVGQYRICARAIDSLGNVQREEFGDYGWRGFIITVDVDYDDDVDGVADSLDNCPDLYNPSQTDSDGDAIGNACDDDCPNLDGLNPVALDDFSILAHNWLLAGPNLPADLNRNQIVNTDDLAILTDYWLSQCYE